MQNMFYVFLILTSMLAGDTLSRADPGNERVCVPADLRRQVPAARRPR